MKDRNKDVVVRCPYYSYEKIYLDDLDNFDYCELCDNPKETDYCAFDCFNYEECPIYKEITNGKD